MDDDHAGRADATRFWDEPRVQKALQAAIERIQQRHGLDEPTARAALYEAVSSQAHTKAATAVEQAREQGTTWRALANALATSISGVRHRYDARVIQQRRNSEQRRRATSNRPSE